MGRAGRRVRATRAPAERPTPTELHAYCREHLAPYKTPRHWTFVDEFPLTPSGKVQKFMLRERFLAEQPDLAVPAKAPTAAPTAPA